MCALKSNNFDKVIEFNSPLSYVQQLNTSLRVQESPIGIRRDSSATSPTRVLYGSAVPLLTGGGTSLELHTSQINFKNKGVESFGFYYQIFSHSGG